MAVILNGIDQGINFGSSDAILSAAGSVFIYFEVTGARMADETYFGLGMRLDDTRAVEIAGIASGFTYQVLVEGGTALSSQATGNIKDGTLRRVFVAWSQESGRRFAYVDGAQQSELSFAIPSPDHPAGGETTLGYRPWADDDERWFEGQLSNVAVWAGAQFGVQTDENTVAAALTSGAAAAADYPGFAAFWPLDYDARDLGPNHLNGTLVGTPVFTESSPRWFRGDGVALRPYLKTSGGLVALE